MKILMVSTEYPPMTGGVGRYTVNLVRALGKYTTNEVVVACDSQGAGDYAGVVSPTDPLDSDNLLRVAAETKPDVVHVQFEPGLYGLLLHPTNPKRSRTHIDSFYARCKVPIVTAFH